MAPVLERSVREQHSFLTYSIALVQRTFLVLRMPGYGSAHQTARSPGGVKDGLGTLTPCA